MKPEKYAAFLFALAILALLAGCTPYTSLYDALTSAKTRGANNPFVGFWVLERTGAGNHASAYDNNRTIYKFTDDNRWESYVVYSDDVITPRLGYQFNGTYSYRGSDLYMTYNRKGYGVSDEIYLSIDGSPYEHLAQIAAFKRLGGGLYWNLPNKWRLDGDAMRPDLGVKLKMYKTRTTLYRVSVDCSTMKQIGNDGQS